MGYGLQNKPLPCFVWCVMKAPWLSCRWVLTGGQFVSPLFYPWLLVRELQQWPKNQLGQIHSSPLWLVVNREVRSHRSNFTIRPGQSRAPDNTRCWNSGGRKSWDTNRWIHTYRHLQRCTGTQKNNYYLSPICLPAHSVTSMTRSHRGIKPHHCTSSTLTEGHTLYESAILTVWLYVKIRLPQGLVEPNCFL